MIEIKKGLALPIEGELDTKIDVARLVRRVAVVGDDHVGMKPSLAVREGDMVKLGELLFTDKKTPGVRYTAPGCGKVVAVNRGAKRKFQSLVIELEGEDEEVFASFPDQNLDQLSRDEVRENLVQSGLWTALRTRPFSKVPAPETSPHSVFVTAIDTNPLAAPPKLVISDSAGDFERGLQVLGRLTDNTVFVCAQPGADVPGAEFPYVQAERFAGPHPAGLAGTHIHFLDPVSQKKTVWYINYQDVIAFGKLFASGRISVDRVVSLSGPAARRSRLIRTRLGASIDELMEGELEGTDVRVISGSVLSGRRADGPFAFLGRYHLQISALQEGRQRVLLDWLRPGINRYSIKNVFASALSSRSKRVPFTTSREGSRRAMVPIGMYERVMPLDILPTQLLRALIVGDTEQAEALGCLELDEEDLALCAFVCPGKYEFGPLLRDCLRRIEEEG